MFYGQLQNVTHCSLRFTPILAGCRVAPVSKLGSVQIENFVWGEEIFPTLIQIFDSWKKFSLFWIEKVVIMLKEI